MKFLNYLFLLCLTGCASVEPPLAINSPDISFSGSLASGNVSGDRSEQVLSEIEAKLFQVFPQLNLLPNKSNRADVFLDVTIYSARIIDTRSSQELRNCRRWSEPDKDSKGSLQRLISRQCLDWQVQTISCLNRKYELDVRIRARQRTDDRVIVSDRKVFEDSDRQCGDKTPAIAALQAQAESKAASWVTSLLRAPLASLSSNQIAFQPAVNTSISLQSVSPQPQSTATTQQISKVIKAYALVIGNGAYSGSARLPNPTNDAKSMSDKLRSLGFDVTEALDADRLKLVAALSQFSKKAVSADITLLFYAGHGVQITGKNYMLPVDLNLNDLTQVPLQGISLNDVVDKYLPGKTKLVFLDACRDNPLMQIASRSVSRGLAPINVSEGTLISYATKDGSVAQDGDGKNSPFTSALLDHIGDPDDIAVVLRKVREKVMKSTGNKQQPWEYGSLTGGALVLSAIKPK